MYWKETRGLVEQILKLLVKDCAASDSAEKN